MKKVFVCLFVAFCVCVAPVFSKSHCSQGHSHGHSHAPGHSHPQGHPHSHPHGHHHGYNHPSHSSSGSSQPVYLVKTDHTTQEKKFPDCSKHYTVIETTTNYYSDGSRRVFVNATLYNSDGSTIITDCNSINHIFHKNNHYFIICRNRGGYSIIDSKGASVTEKEYSKIEQVAQNRFLVRYDKKYGIIDFSEKAIVPIKYQKFQKMGEGIFVTRLNGYYGILDSENNIFVKNDCERIKQIHNTLLLKRYHKYGLADLKGKIIYEPNYDKIKKYAEYILIKKDKEYKVLDGEGRELDGLNYKKIKLERNTLYGYKDKNWVKIY